MIFHVLTLFPEMIKNASDTSIFGRGIRAGHISVNAVDIRDYSVNKNRRLDDYPYGGGAGMVMEAEPVFRAIKSVTEGKPRKPKVIYLTPQAPVLSQTKVEELSRESELVLLCGHYEGIDERVLEKTVDDYISIGDYVLTGGELAALVLMDAVSRFVPGVLSNEESSQFESLQDNLLEYPQYTRPETWQEMKVPPVLLTGDHKKITAWRYAESVKRTKERRPDLFQRALFTHVLFCGGKEREKEAEMLLFRLSRYGEVLDYNRNKLIKSRRCFEKKDLLVCVYDEESLLFTALRNVSGNGTPVFAVCVGSEAPCEEELCLYFQEKGFNFCGSFCFSTDFEEEAEKTALTIRRSLENKADLC